MGRFCRICGRDRPNEKFSGKGHKIHVCKDCQKMPKTERERIEIVDELHGFVWQSRISEKNRKRLKVLLEHEDPTIKDLACLLLQIAAIAEGRRKRWAKIREKDRDLYRQCEELGFTDDLY